ncbi:hypothetical protein [Amycolatopsis pithecellobii]|uniref:Uncharacterized protein n=1 Tax=Amycolatopsis pithecellobii TaxID=664692 RepID=A0A6N7Z1V4_9PSEU|nr:hypothetical protein [Amycolatopsis pithecellobii]MTD55463.1 hypothetical protein [Amycolatopsis pithecellobii]
MVLALVTNWTSASWSLRALDDRADPATPPADFRAGMMTAVEAITTP